MKCKKTVLKILNKACTSAAVCLSKLAEKGPYNSIYEYVLRLRAIVGPVAAAICISTPRNYAVLSMRAIRSLVSSLIHIIAVYRSNIIVMGL